MLKFRIPHLAAFLSILIGLDATAYSEVRFEHLSLEHGLAQSAIQGMVSDELGYMWFGTQYGLSRYDGYGFRNFRHDPRDPNSLSNSRIQSLLRCRDGSIFIGTRSGLNRLDPRTLSIERIPMSPGGVADMEDEPRHYLAMAEDARGNLLLQTRRGAVFYELSSGRLRPIPFDTPVPEDAPGVPISDKAGRVWLYNSHGLWRFEPQVPQLRHVLSNPIDESLVRQDPITVLPSGVLALAGRDGVVLFDPESERALRRIRPTDHGEEDDWVGAVDADPRGYLWLLTRDSLIRHDPQDDAWRQRLLRWQPEDAREQLAYEIDVTSDRRGYVWVGLPEGIGLSSPQGESFRLLQHDPNDPSSLTASPWSTVYEVYVDDFGTVWAGGGLGGLSHFAPQSARFEHVIDDSDDSRFGVDNVVRSVLETSRDDRHFLWTGLSFSGIRVWERRGGSYSRVAAELHSLAPGERKLPDNEVWQLKSHPVTGEVWAGTSGGLVVVSKETFSVLARHDFRVDGKQPRVKAMVFSGDGRRLWVAGSRRLMSFSVAEDGRSIRLEKVRWIAPFGDDAREHSIFGMMQLDDGRLLVGTRRGVVLWDPDQGRVVSNHPAGQAGEHPRNFIFGLARTDDGEIWLGSEQGGLGRGRLRGDRFEPWTWFGAEQGLPDSTIYAILPARSGRLWLSTNRGLVRFNPDTGVSRHFTLGDGLQALEFNNTVATIGDSGLFYFGGINGVNVFRPEEIELHEEPPRVYLQRAEIEGESIPGSAIETLSVSTEHDRNSLVLEYVGLHFAEPARNRYAYRLEGVDGDWVHSGGTRLVRYPDLPAGNYRFQVKAANSDGVWSEPRELMALEVASPPWLTPWAFALYFAAGALLISIFILAERGRRRRLEQVVIARTRELVEQKEVVNRQAEELEEVLDTRTTLFANISHEFRTPLTLIEASIDRLSRNPQDPGAVMAARRYLRRLLRLVDQLLNLSRLQSTRERPVPVPWSLDQVVAMTVDAFRPLAEQRDISLDLSLDGRWMTQCQQADVERILLNLIGNALKYCPAGSSVCVELADAEYGVLIFVRDNGPGIAADQKERIFERFNRIPAHEHGRIEGAGIGLTLVREAARANGGRVDVDSEPGEGSEFKVWLPAWRGHMEGAPVEQLAARRLELEFDTLSPEEAQSGPADLNASGERSVRGRYGTVLVAEDNVDLRHHLSEALSGDWDVLEAGDGAEALRLARERLPDVLVSDIMMPHLDGLELLKRLREDVRTSHLPVLLLTARQDEATRLQGYSLSADDFLSKPFNPAELRLRLQRMVDIRSRVQARLLRQMDVMGRRTQPLASLDDSPVPDLSERDEQLLERVRNWLEANYDDPEVGVAELAEFVAVEQRTLQRKLKALTGRTPAAHLQGYRLERAKELLRDSKRPIQDVAFTCGFSSPQYFTRVFTQQEGLSPSKWRRQGGSSP